MKTTDDSKVATIARVPHEEPNDNEEADASPEEAADEQSEETTEE